MFVFMPLWVESYELSLLWKMQRDAHGGQAHFLWKNWREYVNIMSPVILAAGVFRERRRRVSNSTSTQRSHGSVPIVFSWRRGGRRILDVQQPTGTDATSRRAAPRRHANVAATLRGRSCMTTTLGRRQYERALCGDFLLNNQHFSYVIREGDLQVLLTQFIYKFK